MQEDQTEIGQLKIFFSYAPERERRRRCSRRREENRSGAVTLWSAIWKRKNSGPLP